LLGFSRKTPIFREFSSPHSKKFMPSARLHALYHGLTLQVGKAPVVGPGGPLHVVSNPAVPGECVVLGRLRVVVNDGVDPLTNRPGDIGLILVTQGLRHGTVNNPACGSAYGVFKGRTVAVDQIPAPPFLEVPLHRWPHSTATGDALHREPACLGVPRLVICDGPGIVKRLELVVDLFEHCSDTLRRWASNGFTPDFVIQTSFDWFTGIFSTA